MGALNSNRICTTGTIRYYMLILLIEDTTGVQQPTVYFVRGSTHVLVTCDFASGSRASRCLFNFIIISDVVFSEHYNVSRGSKEKSSLCAGGSQACMCINTERFVTSYATIEVYTLEEDGVTRGSISVPTTREDVSMDPEMISECNPPELHGNNNRKANNTESLTCSNCACILVLFKEK